MSSRRAKAKSYNSKYNDNSKKFAPHEQPPNHPQENLPEHRTFLARSLRRNDEDLAVLVDLNRTLHQVRNNIIKTIGEEFLLDLGEGLFQMTPCESDLMVKPPVDEYEVDSPQRITLQERLDTLEEQQRLLCVDFLLRMKLRRRMLNRLARRLMRVAHAMDGEDVSPPGPPKYGDLRLHVDPEEIKLAKKQWELQMEARQRVSAFRLQHPESLVPLIKVDQDEEEEDAKKEDDEDDDDEEMDTEEKASTVKSDEESKSEDEDDDDDDEEEEEKSEAKSSGDSNDSDEESKGSKEDTVASKAGKTNEDGDVEMTDSTNEDADKKFEAMDDATSNEIALHKDEDKDTGGKGEESTEEELDKKPEEIVKSEADDDANKTKDESDKDSAFRVEYENGDAAADKADETTEDSVKPKEGDDPKLEDNVHQAEENIEITTKESDDITKSDAAKDASNENKPAANESDKDEEMKYSDEDDDVDSKLEENIDSEANADTSSYDKPAGKDEDCAVNESSDERTAEVKKEGSEDAVMEDATAEMVDSKESEETGSKKKEQTDVESNTTSEETEKVDATKMEETDDSEKDEQAEEMSDKLEGDGKELAKSASTDEPKEADQMDLERSDKNETAEEASTGNKKEDPPNAIDAADKKQLGAQVKTEDEGSGDEGSASDNEDRSDLDTGDDKTSEDDMFGDDGSTADDKDKSDIETISAKAKSGDDESENEYSQSDDDKSSEEAADRSVVAKVKSEDSDTPIASGHGGVPKPDEPASTPVKKGEEQDNKEMTGTPARKPLFELPPPRELSQLEQDQEILKEFVDAYSKEINPITGEVSFQILNEEREEDYFAIQNGFGVGAVNRQMSLKEKEVEFKRWQASLLGRIPEAPTFEEIGMKNHVFLLQERRNRLKQKREEEVNSKKRGRSSSVDEDANKTAKKGRNIGAVERKSPAKKAKESDDDEEKKNVTKRMKPLSLVPFPSFHESDLRRIRMVHFDLMTASIQGGAKARFEAAEAEYNAAFRNSNAILDRKVSFENSLQQQVLHYETQYKKLIESYRRSLAMERAQWLQQKTEYDANRLKKLMPSNWNSQPLGTPLTQAVVSKYREGTLPHIIGTCVADIADVVIMKITDPRINDQPFQEFRPSKPEPTPDSVVADPSTGETLRQKLDRIQVHHQREIEAAKAKLAQAEEERKRAWKKMEKSKAEYQQMLSAQSASFSSSSAVASASSSYTPGRRRDLAAYQNTANPNPGDSKYSVARIRERQLPDGSVEPISKKKGVDGFYQRPAGRARKDMNWDPVRGVWVPTGH